MTRVFTSSLQVARLLQRAMGGDEDHKHKHTHKSKSKHKHKHKEKECVALRS